MSHQAKQTLKIIGLVGTIIGTLLAIARLTAGVAEPYMVLPQRIEVLEKRINEVKSKADADHDMMQRVDERTEHIIIQNNKIEARLESLQNQLPYRRLEPNR